VICGVEASRSYVYFRAEHNEADLARAAVRTRAISVGVIRSKYLAPFPDGDDRAGQIHEELATAFRSVEGPYLVDPDTPALCAPGLRDDDVERRLRLTDVAQAVDLPLQLRALRDDQGRLDFVNVNIGMQVGAAGVIAPYLEAHRERDPRLAVNLDMLRETITAVSDGRPVVAVLQTTAHRLRKGFVRDSAPLYAASGVKRVLVRIRRFDPEEATSSELAAYLDAVASFVAHGIGVIPDCVGRLGPVLVAGGRTPSAPVRGSSARSRSRRSTPVAAVAAATSSTRCPVVSALSRSRRDGRAAFLVARSRAAPPAPPSWTTRPSVCTTCML
jgi:hypothetical protein